MPFTAGGLVKASLIGGYSGAITFGIGEATAAISQLATRITVQAVAHGSFQGAVSGIQGGNFWQGFASGAAASIASSLWVGGSSFDAKGNITSTWGGLGGRFAKSGAGMITFGTISGGAGAALTGGNFWQGAATGFVVSAVTHLASDKKLVNPTGKGIRNDSRGEGHYGASRDGGTRRHRGLDFSTDIGQDIYSPVTGKAVYATGPSKGARIDIYPSDPDAVGFTMIRMLYVDRPLGVELWSSVNVTAGAPIGIAADLQTRGYSPLVTPHIHLQIQNGTLPNGRPNWINPTSFFGRLK